MTNQTLFFQQDQRRHQLSLAWRLAVLDGVALLANLTRTCVVQIQARGK